MIEIYEHDEPCWCKSLVRYGECHGALAALEPVSRIEVGRLARRLQERRNCLGTIDSKCAGGVIRAHSISRASALARVAHNGHVLRFSIDFLDIVTGRPPSFERIGISRASTFGGFCKKHDKSLFAPLEDREFRGTLEQIALLSFRAAAHGLWQSDIGLELGAMTRELQKGQDVVTQVLLEVNHRRHMMDASERAFNTRAVYELHRTQLMLRQFESYRYYAVLFDQVPQVLALAALNLEADFHGRIIQHAADGFQRVSMATFSCLPLGTGGIALVTWLPQSDTSATAFARSLHALSDEVLPDTLLYKSISTGHFFIGPSWYEAPAPEVRSALNRWVQEILEWEGRPPKSYLMPRADRLASWHVSGRASNVAEFGLPNLDIRRPEA